MLGRAVGGAPTVEKPFGCERCNRDFKSRTALANHVGRKHAAAPRRRVGKSEPDPPPDVLVTTMTDRRGRVVDLTETSVTHVAEPHPQVRLPDVVHAVERADIETPGRRLGDEILWAQNVALPGVRRV